MSVALALHVSPSEAVISEICALDWDYLTPQEMVSIAWGYYFFSVQFRENLQLACEFYPENANLQRLKTEECRTDNLSPYPGIALRGEKLDHDEFMFRLLQLSPISEAMRQRFMDAGNFYLDEIRNIDPMARALSIASYENGGLERVFKAILRAPVFDIPLLQAFRFFLTEHIKFDSDPDQGHGNLSRHLIPDESVTQLWIAFKKLFLAFAPRFSHVDLEAQNV